VSYFIIYWLVVEGELRVCLEQGFSIIYANYESRGKFLFPVGCVD